MRIQSNSLSSFAIQGNHILLICNERVLRTATKESITHRLTLEQLASESSSPTSTPARKFDSDDDLDDDLPYPQPLPRASFLQPNFDPSAYLSEYIKQNRHQTLSDLRQELRTRSQALQQELLELVNNEYQAFLNLGRDLKGGEEKVESVRVGLLGFVNGVNGVKAGVKRRREEVESLVVERKEIVEEAEKARALVEVYERIESLEDTLQPKWADRQQEASSEDEDEDEDEDGIGELPGGWEASTGFMSFSRLKRLVSGYKDLRQRMEGIGMDHPFLVKQDERMMRIRSTLLLDLGAALRQARSTGVAGHERLLEIATLYADIDGEKECLKLLKDTA